MLIKRLKILRTLVILLALLIVIPAGAMNIFGERRIIALTLFYALFLLGSLWRAFWYGQFSKKAESPDVRRQFGWRYYTVAGIWVMHWLALYQFSRLPRESENALIESAGYAVLGIGTALVWTSVQTLGTFFDRLVIQDGHKLITHGIYGVLRHPVYSSYILLYAGFCLTLESWWGLILLTLCGWFWFGAHIEIEETQLIKKFGKAYEAYQRRTKRIVPFIY